MDIAINQAIAAAAGMATTGLLGFTLGLLKQHGRRERARIEIEKATAREMVFAAYEDYVVRGRHLTIARHDELLRVFEAYTALGGNGTAKRCMDEIEALRPYLVID